MFRPAGVHYRLVSCTDFSSYGPWRLRRRQSGVSGRKLGYDQGSCPCGLFDITITLKLSKDAKFVLFEEGIGRVFKVSGSTFEESSELWIWKDEELKHGKKRNSTE